jgi:hypothetical protein
MSRVLRLKKAIYSLKQAACQWNKNLHAADMRTVSISMKMSTNI